MENMENHYIRRENSGLQSFWYSTPQFKTARVSAHLVVPLTTPEDAALCALVPNVVSRVTKEYPDYTEFGKYLASLYGASMHAGVSASGDNHILTLATSGLANRFAFGKEDVQKALTDLLESCLFTPLTEQDGLFPEEGFQQEKRQLLETIDAEFNDKKVYAKNRCLELMYNGEPAGTPYFGTREAVRSATREGVKAAWERLVRSAQMYTFAISDGADSTMADRFAALLGDRTAVLPSGSMHTARPDTLRVTDEMPLAQSKLVMGFAAGTSAEERLISKMMSIVLGGTPSSKLFLNVREKQSLCYYCSARHDTPKNTILIESGVENANLERAEEAILKEVRALQNGEITDEELLYAKLAMHNAYQAVEDSAYSIEHWYFSNLLQGQLSTPEAYDAQMMAITKEQIVEAARKIHLDVVYKLKGEGAAK